jgi:predicted permease
MSFLRRLLNLGRSGQLSRDIDRELAFHIRERAEELMAGGMPEAQAQAAARRQFGNRTNQGERTRDADVVTWLDSFAGDIRYALRALRRSPVFATVAVLSLALGIGANTAIYSLLDAVVLRSLPVEDPEELVLVTFAETVRNSVFTNPLWEQVRDRASGFQDIAAFSQTEFNTSDGGEERRVRGEWVSGDYFRLLGGQAAAGRLLTKQDDVRGCPGIAVLGYGFWQSEFGGRADAIGQSIRLAGKPFQIVGVASRGFTSPQVGHEPQVYAPICSEAIVQGARSSLDQRSHWWMQVIGRRASDVTLEELQARLKTIAPAVFAATLPGNWANEHKQEYLTRTLNAVPAPDGVSSVRSQYGGALKIMMGAVALLLLIACANVANLLLARATARQREVAIRLAIGAGKSRLVRQMLTESALLALFGAVAGLFVAHWGTNGLVSMISTADSPVSLDLSLSLRVLLFTILVAAFATMLFGLIPVWRGTRVGPQAAMKANARGVAEGHARFTLGKALVVAQVALSLMLLVGAGLLVGSLRNLRTMDTGFTSDGVLIVSANLARTELPATRFGGIRNAVLERVRATPGVLAASTADITPIGRMRWNDLVIVDGPVAAVVTDSIAWFNEISDGYFATLDTRVLSGRDFDRTDVASGSKTAIINEATAKRFFGSTSPLGRTFRMRPADALTDPYTIVGVVENAKYSELREESSGTIYLPASQNADGGPRFNLVVRAQGDPLQLLPTLKEVFAEQHRAISLNFTTLEAQVARTLQRERMLAVLSTLFGAVALSLAMLGLYGVMAYTVARRQNEIGVRIALGANRDRVLRMVLGDVARVVMIGVALGIAGALASGKLVTTFLYGLRPGEPAVLALAALILGLVALGAGLVPALRASRVDPVSALREE